MSLRAEASLLLLLYMLASGAQGAATIETDETTSAALQVLTHSSGDALQQQQLPAEQLPAEQPLAEHLPAEQLPADQRSRGRRAVVQLEPCYCPNPWEPCECREEYGIMETAKGISASTNYTFAMEGEPQPVMIWVNRDYFNITVNDDFCFFIINGQQIKVNDDLRTNTTFYTTTESTVIFRGHSGCYLMAQYAAVRPVYETTHIPEGQLTGVISFPTENQTIDQWGYPPQRRLSYVFSYGENYVIDLTVTQQDIGHRSPVLHWRTNLNNGTQNDFLLIGSGPDILASSDLLLYGHVDGARMFRVNHPSAHVVFYGDYHEQFATGFTVQYEAYPVTGVVVTTAEPPTTPYSPSLPACPSSWAPIDSALESYTTIDGLQTSFAATVASIASQYINDTGMLVDPPQCVSPSDVVVHETATCSSTTCLESCAAFNYSISKLDLTLEAWAFSKDDLDSMIKDETLQHEWADTMCSTCTVCNEEVSFSWWVLGGLAVGVVVVTLVVAVMVWAATARSSRTRAKEAEKKHQEKEALECRRTSVGDVSVIGGAKGTTSDILPFAGGRLNSLESFEDDQDQDLSGFVEYDPDSCIEDFGIGPEVINDSRALNFYSYSNEGFEGDGPILKSSLKRRQPQAGPQGGRLDPVVERRSDETVQFQLSRPRLQFNVPVDVHEADMDEVDIGETGGSHVGETAF